MALPPLLTNNNKVDLDTEPDVAEINKVLAPEYNNLTNTVNALISEIGAASFVGLDGGQSPAVAPTGDVRLKAGAAGLEVSFSGGAYAPVGGSVTVGTFGTTPDAKGATAAGSEITMQPADGTHPGAISLADQTLGAGVKTLQSSLRLLSAPSAPVSGSGEACIRDSGGVLEISQNGGAYVPLSAAINVDTPQALTSSAGHIALSFASGRNFYHTMTENTILDAPSNVAAGMEGHIDFVQHATAAKTLGFNTFWRWSGGVVPALSTTLGSKHLLVFYVGHDTSFATCQLYVQVA